MGKQNSLGHRQTEEHKRKISEANKGRVVSEETRRKIGEAHKGKKLSGEHRRKISEAHKGKTLTEVHKRRISEGLKRRHDVLYQAIARAMLKQAKLDSGQTEMVL